MLYSTIYTIHIEKTMYFSLSEPENVEYNMMDKINVAHVRLELMQMNDKRDCIVVCNLNNLGQNYIKKWKSFAMGYFLPKDFKKNLRDSRNKTPYYVIHYMMNNCSMKALLRRLIEVEDSTVDDERKNELICKYGDINKNGTYYSVIKICPASIDKWRTDDGYGIADIMHDTSPGDFYLKQTLLQKRK